MKKVGSESLVKEESLRSTWAQLSQVPTWKEDFSQQSESGPAVPVTTPLAHSTEMGVEDCSQEKFSDPIGTTPYWEWPDANTLVQLCHCAFIR